MHFFVLLIIFRSSICCLILLYKLCFCSDNFNFMLFFSKCSSLWLQIISIEQTLELFMHLQTINDRTVRNLAFSHIVQSIRHMNQKHKNEATNRKLQNILFSILQVFFLCFSNLSSLFLLPINFNTIESYDSPGRRRGESKKISCGALWPSSTKGVVWW